MEAKATTDVNLDMCYGVRVHLELPLGMNNLEFHDSTHNMSKSLAKAVDPV